MIALVVFTDGRWDLLAQTLDSARDHLQGPITRRVLLVDGEHAPEIAEASVRRALEVATREGDHSLGTLRDWTVVYRFARLGFAGSIARAWLNLTTGDVSERFVFHLEDDFTFNRDVPLEHLAALLDHRPDLAQVALRRQPVNEEEKRAGGIVELWPDEYEDHSDLVPTPTTAASIAQVHPLMRWLEHDLFFTTNPSLYRRELCARGWPETARSEDDFTAGLRLAGLRFAYWGDRESGEWVHHIGDARHPEGTGY